MVVGVCRISLQLEDSQSLKDRRSVVRRIKDRVTQKWSCAIAEVGDLEDIESAQLGFAVVSNERRFTQSMVQKILAFIDDLALAKITDDEQDYIDYGDGAVEGGSALDYPHWEPEEPSPMKGPSPISRPARLETESYPWDSPEPLEASDAGEPAEPGAARKSPESHESDEKDGESAE